MRERVEQEIDRLKQERIFQPVSSLIGLLQSGTEEGSQFRGLSSQQENFSMVKN